MKRFLKINAADNVAVALADDLHEGETLDVEGVAVTLREDVARGHKFALRDIAAGENVVKYGYPIGHATQDVPQGGWIHTHNLKTNLRDDLEYTYAPKVYDVGCPKRDVRVMGYLRGMLADVTQQLFNMHIFIHSLNSREVKNSENAVISATITINGLSHLQTVIDRLQKIKGVISIDRS